MRIYGERIFTQEQAEFAKVGQGEDKEYLGATIEALDFFLVGSSKSQ